MQLPIESSNSQKLLKIGGTMDKIRYCKWGNRIAQFSMLLRLLAVISAQPGFLSISCGGKANHTDVNNIKWVTDANYIDVGETADIGNASAYGSYFYTLRLFPRPLNKSCYQVPLAPNATYLLRLWFVIGNYDGFPDILPRFSFSIETVDLLAEQNVILRSTDAFYNEFILASSGTVLHVCLIRTYQSDDPFISAIDLRTLQNGMYDGQAKPGTMLNSRDRKNVGGNWTFRYPQDNFDRLWISDLNVNAINVDRVRRVSSNETISTNNTKDLPPIAVMQTACVVNNGDSIPFPLESFPRRKRLLVLYFAEIEMLNMYERRSFYVKIKGEMRSGIITLIPNHSAVELTFLSNASSASDSFVLCKATDSTLRPIITAYEYYLLVETEQATFSQDADALDAIKRRFGIKDWVSDPCYLKEWPGIGCHNTSAIRISEIDLSGRSLTGSVPNDLAKLTALVNLSLDNNRFMGSLPNLSNLTMLERLYLQNNNLNGPVPVWLSKLRNLKELNIENNNYSGVISAQLLHNCVLKFNYSANRYLSMDKRGCTLQISKKNYLKVVLGMTLSGVLIIVLGLIVGVVVYRNKLRRNADGVASESSRVDLNQGSRITVPDPTKCRAFNLDEMTTATQNFSREIGRGGFGSVFFGKLPEGNNVAVKVLSLSSRQGVHEFLNEVNLLSRINHRNLVSLIGYCNESREVMLIYEHMSRGSLRDHLYGPNAENSQLSWKARLKIALDAAHGLEYLHAGSTPKIIHRDIKTANILIDGNFNGKLSDFGLSRMTIDGQASHVTTVVKGTFGYLDPEYYNTQMLTEKSDVYSFGVVLLEITCGRPPINHNLTEEEVNLIRWATPYILDMDENAGKVTEIIDKRLVRSYDMKSMTRVVKVAMRCVQAQPSSRPIMSEIVAELKEAIKHEDSVDSSERQGMESPLLELEWSDNSSNILKVGR